MYQNTGWATKITDENNWFFLLYSDLSVLIYDTER